MWSLKTIEADVADIGQALDDAVSTYRADAGDNLAHRAVDAAASFAKALVAEGVFGDRVQVAMSGHANPSPTAEGPEAPDQVSLQVRAVPSPGVTPTQEEPPTEALDTSSAEGQGLSRAGRASRAARSTEED